ncbi:hypothetical protein XNC1_4170 [Xenorhabdus nematophila ATCC 19061]|uniref:Uncharacterized protein n=1 Tax=Xenorhabdus nematophila (strain ATCC 19061 / DSM 3370 / CCUG 14189 / LMG 1036 / NCIMB 9965 / AN6) TaxID=406817 RepID=D3VDF5_XENNA|nr:hypothetical protein XNC1_4170 [Xenorhabdus nematophila ATCC 19061]
MYYGIVLLLYCCNRLEIKLKYLTLGYKNNYIKQKNKIYRVVREKSEKQ